MSNDILKGMEIIGILYIHDIVSNAKQWSKLAKLHQQQLNNAGSLLIDWLIIDLTSLNYCKFIKLET